MGIPENPMRLRMEEAAQDGGVELYRQTSSMGPIQGTPSSAALAEMWSRPTAGSGRAREVYAVHLPTRADIVVIDSHSADRDFWQSAKGPYAGTMAVKDGGSMICVSPNPEGVAKNHENLLKIGYRPHAEIVHMVQSGEVDDWLAWRSWRTFARSSTRPTASWFPRREAGRGEEDGFPLRESLQ